MDASGKHYLTCLWPGLPEMWFRGQLAALPAALTFALAVWYFNEAMPAGRWIGFGIVWIALIIFTVDAWHIRPGGPKSQRARAAAIAAEAI